MFETRLVPLAFLGLFFPSLLTHVPDPLLLLVDRHQLHRDTHSFSLWSVKHTVETPAITFCSLLAVVRFYSQERRERGGEEGVPQILEADRIVVCGEEEQKNIRSQG